MCCIPALSAAAHKPAPVVHAIPARRWTIAPVLAVFTVTFPFFALVLAGYVAASRGLLRLEAIPGLNGFVLFFALPCMLFRFGAGTPLHLLLDPAVAAVYLLCSLAMVGILVAWSRSRHRNWNDAAFGAMVGTFPNSGFMGVPLLVALLGPLAAGPVILSIMIDMLVTSSLCIALSRLDGAGAAGARQAAGKALRGVATNPMPWAILLGIACQAAGVTLWKPVDDTVGLLAAAASPVALFTIGAVLARSRRMALEHDGSTSGAHPQGVPPDVFPVAAAKLFLHPLLVLLAGLGAQRMGLPLSAFALSVIVLTAALPSASNVSLLAERFGADNGRVARIILWTTVVAFFSFSGAVALVV